MEKTRLILVGGFLGAGKTTLLWTMAKHLADQGKRVGLITNDQASELVDTSFLSRTGGRMGEVSGSCFCCNFDGFVNEITKMQRNDKIDVIIAEPVGSCTDLSATIVQPLKEHFRTLAIAPLTALIDPQKLKGILGKEKLDMHESAAYIVEKQLEEADYIVINKCDLLSEAEVKELEEETGKRFPKAKVFAISGEKETGVDTWLEAVMTREEAGTHLAQVNYDTYAEGEAVLGWLNATIQAEGKVDNWAVYVEDFMYSLGKTFDDIHAEVGHVKTMIEQDENFVIANLTGKLDTLRVRGSLTGTSKVRMTVNARVEMTPEQLEEIVRQAVAAVDSDQVTCTIEVLKCLQPGRPNPTHRYEHVVK